MRIHPIAVVALAAILAGCASQPKSPASATDAAPAVSSAAAPAPEMAKPVAIPAASTRNIVLNMTGTKISTEAKDWTSFKDEWKSTFSDYAKTSGAKLTVQDGEPHSTGEAGTLVTVYVNDYRQVGIGARIFFGIMTGNAYIDAKVSFSDLATGNVFGDQAYSTTSSAWGGVFAKMTPQQVDAISSEVWKQIDRR